MTPIDSAAALAHVKAWLAAHTDCADDGVILGYAHEAQYVWMRDIRALVAEYDRLTAELAQAKLIGAAEKLQELALISDQSVADYFNRMAADLRERAAKEEAGGG